MKVFGKQLVNLATNHFNFWMPFAFDYLVAPFMGVLFYCSMKGEAWFPACMERVYLGTQPPPWTPGSRPVGGDRAARRQVERRPRRDHARQRRAQHARQRVAGRLRYTV